ncbi:MAG TPA: universal stress protein [Gammaproteobacteria bacterium]
MKVVLPFDGSPSAGRAVAYVVDLAARVTKQRITVELINVQDATVDLPGAFVRDAADVAEQLASSALERGGKLLAKPSATLERAGLKARSKVLLGEPADEIAAHVKDTGADAVVMGTRGLGVVGGLVLGSVASKVVHLVKVPVTLVK